MKQIIIFTIFFFIILSSFSQTHVISGFVKDINSGENIIGASVYISGTTTGNVTNENGFYSITYKSDNKISVIALSIGYKLSSRMFVLKNDTVLNFNLRASSDIESVTVTAERNIHQNTTVSSLQIPIKDIKIMPSLSGETDVLKVFQLMPGVQSGQEGSSALYVRGGSADQNLFLIDKVPLYYVNHLGGFISVFDDNAINSMQLIKGGFPARYGGRLSSVIDMRMKNGNKKDFHGEIKIGIIASKLFLEGPIVKDKTSFMFSARRSNIDLFSRAITNISYDGFTAAYTFYDIYGKIHHKFSDKTFLFVSAYSGRDRITIQSKENPSNSDPFLLDSTLKYNFESDLNIKWGNQLTTIRVNHLFGKKLFGNLSVSYSKFYYINEKDYLKKDSSATIILEENYKSYNSGVNDFTCKLDFDYFPTYSNNIKFGIYAISHKFTPGIINYQENYGIAVYDTVFGNKIIYTNEINSFIEDEIKFKKIVSLNIGVFASIYNVSGTIYKSIQPRLVISFKIADNFSIKTAYSDIQQNMHLLSNSGTGIPTDIWLPSSNQLKPQSSKQYVFNMTYSEYKKNLELSIEVFYKDMNNLIDFKEGSSYILDNTDWASIIERNGFGRVYGLEFLIQKKIGKTTGWIAYTLSKSERKFENINSGNFYPSQFDRRHDIAVVVNYKLNDKIYLSANWVYSSGNLMTLSSSKYQLYLSETTYDSGDLNTYEDIIAFKPITAYYYGGKNNFRLPAYHRLDISFNYTKQKKHGNATWQAGIYNAYNKKNIFFLYYKNQGKDLYKFTLFPIIPSISYSFKF